MEKKIAFIDFLKIIDNKFVKNPNLSNCNDYSKLKIFKLLFFTTAITVDANDEGLLSVFNNFYAMKYGPVENNIYEMIKNKKFEDVLNFKDGCFELLPIAMDEPNGKYYSTINAAIEKLLVANPDLFSYTPMQLVELSHYWNSWKICFGLAKRNNKESIKIPNKMIQNDQHYFVL